MGLPSHRWVRVGWTIVLWTLVSSTWLFVPAMGFVTMLSLLNDQGTAAQQFYTCLASFAVAMVDAVIGVVAVSVGRRRPAIGVLAVVVPWAVLWGLYLHLRALQRLG